MAADCGIAGCSFSVTMRVGAHVSWRARAGDRQVIVTFRGGFWSSREVFLLKRRRLGERMLMIMGTVLLQLFLYVEYLRRFDVKLDSSILSACQQQQ